MPVNNDRPYSAFFYGTLMHPDILKRVIGNDGTHLKICSAILLDHTRHQIKHADYPAVIPYSRSKTLFDRDLSPEEKSVRGSLVFGLSESDVRLLDIFEGDEYTRDLAPIYPLSSPTSLSSLSSSSPPSTHSPYPHPKSTSTLPPALPHSHTPAALPAPIFAHTYIWCHPPSQLEPRLWSFEEFVANNAWKWVGVGGDGNRDFLEVDRRREMGGFILRCGGGGRDHEGWGC